MESLATTKLSSKGQVVIPEEIRLRLDGVVGNDTHRKLDVNEFRGFALTDPYAPVVFVNGADAKSAQMFTLAHELAHVWLGPEGEGLSGFDGIFPGDTQVEKFCDQAASGGDFYNNQNTRVGPKFATSVIYAALEGRLNFREAYDLTGLCGRDFREYAGHLGIDLP